MKDFSESSGLKASELEASGQRGQHRPDVGIQPQPQDRGPQDLHTYHYPGVLILGTNVEKDAPRDSKLSSFLT